MMAKTNTQRVQQLASQLGGRINSRTFFLHRSVRKYFEDLVMSLTKRYDDKTRVPVTIVWDSGQELSAFTDHRCIVANANWSLLKGLSRPERFLALHGMVYHETAHILYTDRKYRNFCMKKIAEERVLYPEPDVECEALKQMLASGKHTNAFLEIWNVIRNSLEDGYIEYAFLEDYTAPRFSDGLKYMRRLFLGGFKPLSEQVQMEQSENDRLFTILNILLEYAKFGVLPCKNRREQMDERIQAVVNAIPYIDDVNMLGENEDHYRSINNVAASLQEYLLPYLESLPEEDEARNNPGGNPDCDGNGVPQELNRKLRQMAQQAGLSDCSGGTDSADDGATPVAKPVNRTGDGHKPRTGNEPAGNPEPETQEQTMEQAVKAMKQLLGSISTEKATKQLEEENRLQLQEENSMFEYGYVHSGVSCTINRIKEVSEEQKEAYQQVQNDIERLARETAKGLRQVLKDRRNGSVQRGLYFGKSMSPVSYARHDKKYFQNKKLPTESPTLSIAVVIDESGSMSGRKIESAKTMALVVYNFCAELGIRLMVIGHTASNAHVDITNYCDFGGSFDNNDIYRIMGIHSKSCNRDGYVNQYAVQKLAREQSDMKLCIVISDGAPNDTGYGGETAYEDIKKVKRNAKTRHIDTVVAAIDDDKDDIRRIYGEDSFLDISDLEKLPKAIVALIKKYMKAI